VRVLENKPRPTTDSTATIQQAPIQVHSDPSTEQNETRFSHLQIRRRTKRKHSLSILIRQNGAQRPLSQLAETLVLGALVQHIRAEIPVGPSLVDGIPLVLLVEISTPKVLHFAGRSGLRVHLSESQLKQLGDLALRAASNSVMPFRQFVSIR
jgi:hypothetical protein